MLLVFIQFWAVKINDRWKFLRIIIFSRVEQYDAECYELFFCKKWLEMRPV